MGIAGRCATARLVLCIIIGLPLWGLVCEADCLSRSASSAAAAPANAPAAGGSVDTHHHHAPPAAGETADVPAADAGAGAAPPAAAATWQPEPGDCVPAALAVTLPSRPSDRHAPALSPAIIAGATTTFGASLTDAATRTPLAPRRPDSASSLAIVLRI